MDGVPHKFHQLSICVVFASMCVCMRGGSCGMLVNCGCDCDAVFVVCTSEPELEPAAALCHEWWRMEGTQTTCGQFGLVCLPPNTRGFVWRNLSLSLSLSPLFVQGPRVKLMNAVVNITTARSSGTVGLCIDLAFVRSAFFCRRKCPI